MKVTYIYHSSFAVELEKSILIFDYYGKGDLPERPAGKQVYFLHSHSHPDHFSKTIFNLREQFGGAEYVLAREIRLKPEEMCIRDSVRHSVFWCRRQLHFILDSCSVLLSYR